MSKIDIAAAIIASALMGIVAALIRSDARVRARHRGRIVLRYGFWFRVIAVAVLVIPVLGLSALAFFHPLAKRDILPFAGMVAFFIATGGALVAEAIGTECVADDKGLSHRSVWSGRRFIPWYDVESFFWDESMRWWVLTARDGRRIRLHEWLPGVGEIRDLVARHAWTALS